MKLERWALKKWTLITLFCGAHSFFWGVMTNASIPAMLLGLTTLILMFSAIDSSPYYQGKRLASPLFARAMDKGVRFRIYITCYILLSYLVMFLIPAMERIKSTAFLVIAAPYMGEMWIGEGAMMATEWLTGIQTFRITNSNSKATNSNSLIEHFIATYSTTLITGLLHTVILALICGMFYGVMKLRQKVCRLSIHEEK